MQALPWTIGLLVVATLMSFALGTILGALLAWPRAPRWLGALVGPLLTLSAIPYYLLGLILLYIFAFYLKKLPLSGGYSSGTNIAWSFRLIVDVLKHSHSPRCVHRPVRDWLLGARHAGDDGNDRG